MRERNRAAGSTPPAYRFVFDHPDDQHVLEVVPHVDRQPARVGVVNRRRRRRGRWRCARATKPVYTSRACSRANGDACSEPATITPRRPPRRPSAVITIVRQHQRLHRQTEERVAHRRRACGDRVDRHEVDRRDRREVTRAGVPVPRCRAVVHARDAVALTHVVEPLQVEERRGDDPRASRERQPERGHRHSSSRSNARNRLRRRLCREGQPRVGRHDVVVAEQPQIGDQQERIEPRTGSASRRSRRAGWTRPD